jgi:hypothetical protein
MIPVTNPIIAHTKGKIVNAAIQIKTVSPDRGFVVLTPVKDNASAIACVIIFPNSAVKIPRISPIKANINAVNFATDIIPTFLRVYISKSKSYSLYS